MSDKEKKQIERKGNVRFGTEKRTALDEQEEQMHVDDIPLEDLKLEQEEEKDGNKIKKDSQSERKYKSK
jgi:hypothetical protein